MDKEKLSLLPLHCLFPDSEDTEAQGRWWSQRQQVPQITTREKVTYQQEHSQGLYMNRKES